MLIGLSGSLITHHFAERILPEEFAGRLGETSLSAAHQSLVRWWHAECSQLGPASSVRAVWDKAAAPLAEHLGFAVEASRTDGHDTRHALLQCGSSRLVLFATTWNSSLDTLWREAVRSGIGLDAPWVFCTNGHQWRLIDTVRTYSRAYLHFDLRQTIEHPATFGLFWGVLREEAFRPTDVGPSLVVQVIQSSARHGHAVNRSLRFGVIESVQCLLGALNKCGRHNLDQLLDESLTIVYRLLFLMFAESRGLVPNWHPLYRESYTVEALRDRVERGGPARGLWETLQAIARLAHKGCRAGRLIVPPFNGRLFSPARSPISDTCAVDDESARQALIALSSTGSGRPNRLRRGYGGPPKLYAKAEGRHYRGLEAVRDTSHAACTSPRTRIDYRDLGVEQLGAVYESVLDYEPAFAESDRDRIILRKGGQARKSTGSFYTPQTITDFVVRRTLHPLVDGKGSDEILDLRIVDPAMGSAAFLVSACRYLARAYERALVVEGTYHEGDVDESDRASFRRLVAQRCLFGVDLNSTAVQLARLSLWLATLSANKPLTFLDHHLACGNSLLGASPVDLARQPPGGRSPRRADAPLFLDADLEPALARAVAERRWLAETRDDTAEVVREKEARLDRLRGARYWKSVADLWCACWMWPEARRAPSPAVFASLAAKVTSGGCELPEKLSTAILYRPTRSSGRTSSSTGCWSFPKCSSTRQAGRRPTEASTRYLGILRGTCCAPAASKRHSFEAQASIGIRRPGTSIVIRFFSSGHWH